MTPCAAIERLLESPTTPLTDRVKAAPPSDSFECSCRRLPTSSGCLPRTTCVSALPLAAAPRARSPPAPLQPCAQSPSNFAAAAVPAVSIGSAGSCTASAARQRRMLLICCCKTARCGPAPGRWRTVTRDEAQGVGTQFSQHGPRSGRAAAAAWWAGCLVGHVGPGWWCLLTARLSPPLAAVSAPETAGTMHAWMGAPPGGAGVP